MLGLYDIICRHTKFEVCSMGCKVSKTIVLEPHPVKKSGRPATSSCSPESASVSSTAPTAAAATDSSSSNSRSASPPDDGPELSSHSNLVILHKSPEGKSTPGEEINEIACDNSKAHPSPAQLISNGWSGTAASSVAGDLERNLDSELGFAGQEVVNRFPGTPGFFNANGKCGSSGGESAGHVHQTSQSKCATAPNSPLSGRRLTPPGPAGFHCTEAYAPSNSAPQSAAATPPTGVGKPPLIRIGSGVQPKAIRITSVTVVQQPEAVSHLSSHFPNGFTSQAEDGVEQDAVLRTTGPVFAHSIRPRVSGHTEFADQQHTVSSCNGGHVRVTNSHCTTIDYVHSFVPNYLTEPETTGVIRPVNTQTRSPGGKQKAGIGRSKISPRNVNVTNSTTEYVMNADGRKITAVHRPVASATSTPEEKTKKSPVANANANTDANASATATATATAGFSFSIESPTLPSLDSRRKLPPLQASPSHPSSELKLSNKSVDPFVKPSLLYQTSPSAGIGSKVMINRSASPSPSLFRDVEVASAESSPSSASSRPMDCRASIDSSSSSSESSSDTMIGSRFKQTLDKADMVASGWTNSSSIEDFFNSSKTPNMECEVLGKREHNSGGHALQNSLDFQDDAISFDSSKVRPGPNFKQCGQVGFQYSAEYYRA